MEDAIDRFSPGVVLNNRYQLQRELGRGGMGAVFAARDTLLDAPVAIKVLLGDRPSANVTKRFLQEARAAAQVRHANIVSVLDIGQDESSGALFLVQEFLQGRDLRRRVEALGALSPRQAVELLVPVMRGLAFAHSRGVVHRDLKPDNIFLCDTNDGVVPKIIDFGIAKVTDEQGQSAQNTRTTQVLGTPFYMSPEQARGDRAVDQRSDIWSLGVVLFYALTRRYPHEGATTNLIITNIIARQPTPITHYTPTLPQPVVELVHGALQYEPEQRYASMDAFTQAARSCLAALDSHVDAASAARISNAAPMPQQPAPDVYTVAPQVMATVPMESSGRSRVRTWMLLVAVLLLGSCAGVATYLSTRSNAKTLSPPAPRTTALTVAAPVAPVTVPAAQPSAAPAVVARPQPEALAPTPPPIAAPPPAPPVAATPVAQEALQQPAVAARVEAPPTQRPRVRPRPEPQAPRIAPRTTEATPPSGANPFY